MGSINHTCPSFHLPLCGGVIEISQDHHLLRLKRGRAVLGPHHVDLGTPRGGERCDRPPREQIGCDWGFELDCEFGFEGDIVRELGFEFVVGKRGSQWKWRGIEMEIFTAVAKRIHARFKYFIRWFQ